MSVHRNLREAGGDQFRDRARGGPCDFALKNSMKALFDEHSFPLVDLGPETADPVDYPDMAGKLAAAAAGEASDAALSVESAASGWWIKSRNQGDQEDERGPGERRGVASR
jgi:hypothetical protein